jgi:uncharacterized protein YbaR (Trm112 family)
MLSPETLQALCCPRCPDGALGVEEGDGDGDGALICARCGRRYPLVGGIACLLDDPELWRATWAARLADYATAVAARMRALDVEAQTPGLLPRTRARVVRTAAALADQQRQVSGLLADLAGGELAAASAAAAAMPPRSAPQDQLQVLECYENVFRDWVWGDPESDILRAIVVDLFASAPRSLAIYGAGAGRLAYDVHRTLTPRQTFAFDINPLPLSVAARLLDGERVELVEFPVAAHGDDQVVMRHQLQPPAPAPEGLTLMFADAYRPPFVPGSLEAVLTPWFIDATSVDFRDTAAAINRVLRPGGLWINCGPLRFRDDLSRSYVIEEVIDIVADSGFAVGERGRHDIPYFDSPASGSRRTETVFTFTARKSGEVTRPASGGSPSASYPAWIVDPRLPVPPSTTLATLQRSSVFTAGVLSLVDGQRSMADIAGVLAASWQAPPAAMLDQLRVFFVGLVR